MIWGSVHGVRTSELGNVFLVKAWGPVLGGLGVQGLGSLNDLPPKPTIVVLDSRRHQTLVGWCDMVRTGQKVSFFCVMSPACSWARL